MDKNTIILDAQQALGIVQTTLPLIEMAVPEAAAADAAIRLGVTAAQALIPLIQKIPTGELLSVEDQAALFARVNKIVTRSPEMYSGPEWEQSGFKKS